MTSTLEGVRDLLVAKLRAMEDTRMGVPADTKLFADVRAHADGGQKKWPAAVVWPTGWDGQVIDTHRYERTYHFRIELMQEISEPGKGKAEAGEIMVYRSDRVMQALDQDKDLGGEVEIVNPVSATYDFSQTAGVRTFATFIVDVRVIVPSWDAGA